MADIDFSSGCICGARRIVIIASALSALSLIVAVFLGGMVLSQSEELTATNERYERCLISSGLSKPIYIMQDADPGLDEKESSTEEEEAFNNLMRKFLGESRKDTSPQDQCLPP